MLTSLLSLYIATVMETPVSGDFSSQAAEASSSKVASLSFSQLSGSNEVPIKDSAFISPILGAEASIAVDKNTGTVLHEENAHSRLQIASITKLMTILIVLEENGATGSTTVSNNAANTEGSTMFLRAGEDISIENLLYGAIINSANDSAVALAEHNAGDVNSFVEKMNTKALSLGLINTHFSNPIGLDHPNNYSSAYDLVKLGKYVYEKPFVKKAAKIKDLSVTSIDGNLTHKLESTNDLLDSYLNIKGLKTGHTNGAGLCFISIAV